MLFEDRWRWRNRERTGLPGSPRTRNTGTLHTSAKGQLRNDVVVAVAMPANTYRALQHHTVQLVTTFVSPSTSSDESGKQSLYSDGDPDCHQNLIICSLARCQPSLKISCKSVWTFLHKVANKQTDKQRC